MLVTLLTYPVDANVGNDYTFPKAQEFSLKPLNDHYRSDSQSLYYNDFLSLHPIKEIDKLKLLNYLSGVLSKASLINDQISSYNSFTKYAYFKSQMDILEGLSAYDILLSIVENLQKSEYLIPNVIFILTVIYIDKISETSRVYPTSGTIRRLFGSCLLVVVKMYNRNIPDEAVADICELSMTELHDSETFILQEIKDFSVHPQLLIDYVKPLA